MSEVEAIYQQGVFRPLGRVAVQENEKVRLTIEPVQRDGASRWLGEVQELQRRFIAQHGQLPDSTPDIVADRARDE